MSINLGENKLSDVIKMDTGTGGSNDYNDLNNKPQINGITLQGNKTSSELGIITGPTDVYTKQETNNLIDAKITEAGATKADTSYVNEQLNLKASKSDVNLALASKADVNSVYTKEETTSAINSAITGKADTSYVNEQLNLKADKSNTYTKSEVNTEINDLESTIDVKLNNKADKSSTYTKEETNQAIADNITEKADTSYVNNQLSLKADKADTYTKDEVDDMFDNPTITGDTLPVGSVVEWTGTQTPQNWLLCDGREVSRETYSELFAAIGTIWGSGDGTTSFNIPDYRDKFVLGAGGDVDLAETGGEKEVTLTLNEVPPHYHYLNNNGNDDTRITMNAAHTGGNNYNAYMDSSSSTELGPYIVTNSSGGGQPHNNMPPYVGTYYIIKAKQSAGVVATVVDNLSSTSTTDALSANQGKKLNDLITPVTLYEGTEMLTSINLSDTAANYKFFEIIINHHEYNPTMINEETFIVFNPNGKTTGHSWCYYDNGKNQVYAGRMIINIQNNIINITNNIVGTVGAATAYHSTDKMFKITKVLGYK